MNAVRAGEECAGLRAVSVSENVEPLVLRRVIVALNKPTIGLLRRVMSDVTQFERRPKWGRLLSLESL